MSELVWNEVGAVTQRITWSGENEGDEIQGMVEEFKEVTRKDGTTAMVLTLSNEDTGDCYTVWTKSQLLRLVKDAQVKPGDLIKIVYLGMQKLKSDKTKSFRSYKLFRAERLDEIQVIC